MMEQSACVDIFLGAQKAIVDGKLIYRSNRGDKEFHYQNWFSDRLDDLGILHEAGGRNSYPDFRLVRQTEGYELKGLAWPGRDASYDANSQVPSGLHNGRTVFYVFRSLPGQSRRERVPGRRLGPLPRRLSQC